MKRAIGLVQLVLMKCYGCEKAHLKMAINHQSRCDPFYNCAKQPVNNGHIGELRIIRTIGVDTGFDLTRIMDPPPWHHSHFRGRWGMDLDDVHTSSTHHGRATLWIDNGYLWIPNTRNKGLITSASLKAPLKQIQGVASANWPRARV